MVKPLLANYYNFLYFFFLSVEFLLMVKFFKKVVKPLVLPVTLIPGADRSKKEEKKEEGDSKPRPETESETLGINRHNK